MPLGRKIIVNRSFRLLVSVLIPYAFAGISYSPACLGQAGLLQLNISGVVPMTSPPLGAPSSAADPRQQAIDDASVKLWRVLRTRPEFASKVVSLRPEQDAQMARNLSVRCTVNDLESFAGPGPMVTFRFRYDCDQQGIQSDIALEARKVAQASQTSGAGDKPLLTFLFFARAETGSRIYDDEVSKVQVEGSKNSNSAQQSMTASADVAAKVKSTVEAVEVTRGKAPGNESVQQNGSASSRAAVNASVEGAASAAASTATEKTNSTSGMVVRRAAETITKVSSPAALSKGLVGVFSNAQMELVDYADISAGDCTNPEPAISVASIAQQYEKMPVEIGGDLPAETRRLVIKAARDCGVSFLGYGMALIGLPQVDPTSGGRRVHVRVSAQVWRLPKVGLTRTVATVPETDVVGIGSDDSTAIANALARASEAVGQDLINRMSSWGIQ